MEGVAFAIRAHVEELGAASTPATEMRVSGRPASLRTWNHIKADVLGIPVLGTSRRRNDVGGGDAGRDRRRHLLGCQIRDCDRVPSRPADRAPDIANHDQYTTLYDHYRTVVASATLHGGEG